MGNFPKKQVLIFFIFSCSVFNSGAQILLMDLADTTSKMHVSGYIQPQYQVASEKGIQTYSGGDFAKRSDNRMMLRRARVRLDYNRNNFKSGKSSIQFVFQVDATERGVFVRDMWGRVLENKFRLFAFTAGMFARPFGFEVNHSSGDRESPERGRMSQILMKTERDLGMMLTFQPRDPEHPLHWLKVDAGIFNGQGLIALSEYDSFKDFIARASLLPLKTGSLQITGGLSFYHGGILQQSKYHNSVHNINGVPQFVTDSAQRNIGAKAPRRYKGADIQLKWKYGKATTDFRAEYWMGRQSSIAATSETPDHVPEEPVYTRNFDGAFLYLLHRFHNRHQLGLKYDWYDPNINASAGEISSAASFHAADTRYHTIGMGYIYYLNENFKVIFWYDNVRNESTGIPGYTSDIRDNVFTCRFQFQF